ncbi:RNAse P Rpr2/Rpp21/SNM1 subunit domain-containing protein [Lipomyces chichibuensis]|uniref:RNAse P Rpr2/Rpp21/SNM1 subunit domain-containing protein n=1 Tax=Lipomyces chichibuensis TaxID=1546026 RepID=UPI003343C2DC
MAKKESKKTSAALTKSLKNRDQYLRTSFLYQASVLMANTAITTPEFAVTATSATAPLARYYASQMKSVARKSVIRLDPNMKRFICKRCDTVLIAGRTCAIAVENESVAKVPHADVLTHTCKVCGGQKRFPIGKKKDFVVFTERPDHVVE